MTSQASCFAEKNITVMLRRFDFFYFQEDRCIEYFVKKRSSREQISRTVIFSFNQTSKQINVAKFYPELYKQFQCKYLSAACFYLLTHHFAGIYHLPKGCPICLETRPETYKDFFSKLKDFCLRVEGIELCKTAKVCGKYPDLDLDISRVKKKLLEKGEVPFLM